jgi:O-antigen chain-terminating methyltransferase
VGADADAARIEELRQIIQAVKERVRARYPRPADSAADGGPADLMPLVHARDAAQSKIAAIGSVNPRAGGAVNRGIQAVKKLVGRSLQWFVREQIVFNREIVSAVEATLEALNRHNRAIADLAAQASAAEWRTGMEQKLAASEIQLLRTVAELQGAFQYRATQIESNFHDLLKSQHANYLGALDRANLDIQKRLWADMEKIRWQYERMIHTELRLIRQRAGRAPDFPAQAPLAAQPSAAPALDYARFAERFRGPEENVRKSLAFYRPWFEGRASVLDIGCGRGEFLELMRDLVVPAKGIDLSEESVAECRSKGLNAETADLFTALGGAPDGELDGIFCSQVVEHLDPLLLPGMISLCAEKLARGGVIAIETPNPECLAIFASFFYLDPTHTRPVPSPLLEFYMTEAGLSEIETHPLSPAIEMFPEIAELPEVFRKRFFGGLDYAIIGRKL